MQVSSIPACNSYQYHEKKCETATAAAPLMQVNSIPACNSYQYHEKKCETATAAAPLMQVSSIPACNSYQYHEKKCETATAAAPLMQVNSIPACTSFECQKRDQSQVIDSNAVQTNSDPVCSSAGCGFKNKATHPMDYYVPNFGIDSEILDAQKHESNAQAALHRLRDEARAAASQPAAAAPPSELKGLPAELTGAPAAPAKAAAATTPVAPAQAAAPAKAAAIQLESDPTCNSYECFTHHTLWKEDEKVVEYPISTAETLDPDMKMTQANIKAAETKLGSTWEYKPEHAGYVSLSEDSGRRWNKDWRQHRFHFKNNYKNFPAKAQQRRVLNDKMMDNWGTNQY